MKLKTFFLLITVFFTVVTSANPIRAYLSYSVFNTPVNQPYIETYLAISGNSIVQVSVSDSLYQGTVEVQMIFRMNDSIVNYDKFELSGPKLKDTLKNNFNYLNVERYALPNGTYQLELLLNDKNSTDNPTINFTEFTIDFRADSLSFSDIELLQKFTKDSVNNKMVKNGYELIPYVFNYYPEQVSVLSFYAELYNSNIAFDNGQFLLSYYIRPFEVDNKLDAYSSIKKTNSSGVNILLNSIDISKLPSGNYLLVLEARNRNNELVAMKEIFFQRYNSITDNYVVNMEAIDAKDSFVSAFTSRDTLVQYIEYLESISTQAEKTFVKGNLRSADMETLREYFLGFWVQRDPNNPEGAWKDYKARVDQANFNFKTVSIPGYKSDRGRIYLQYGQPNTISESYTEPSAYPYTIWHYYSMGSQRDVVFVFYTHEVATNDFQLIHSNAVGELQNYTWQRSIFQRTWGFQSVDDAVMPPTWGSNVDTYYLYPR
ncbi:MAG TPA: GWxTD domain-containing protein [Bacteroidales bacterium]